MTQPAEKLAANDLRPIAVRASSAGPLFEQAARRRS
jgi:hypothetical protein